MIQINIEMPKDCSTCPFAVHYDSGGAHGFYCSLSNTRERRWGKANDDGFKFADCPVSAVENKMQVIDKMRAEIEQKIEQERFARSVFRGEEKDAVKAEQCTGSIFAYNNVIKLIDKYKAEQESEK